MKIGHWIYSADVRRKGQSNPDNGADDRLGLRLDHC